MPLQHQVSLIELDQASQIGFKPFGTFDLFQRRFSANTNTFRFQATNDSCSRRAMSVIHLPSLRPNIKGE
jgi:hypothetical protein